MLAFRAAVRCRRSRIGLLKGGVMVDLIFTYYGPDDDIPEEAFEITSNSDRGGLWLASNTDTTTEGDVDELPAGNFWVKTKIEFERLYTKALTDGLVAEKKIAPNEPA